MNARSPKTLRRLVNDKGELGLVEFEVAMRKLVSIRGVRLRAGSLRLHLILAPRMSIARSRI